MGVNITATPSPYTNLSAVINGLRGSLGLWGHRGFLNQALVLLLYRRLFVICQRMERLALRFQAGRIWRRPVVAVLPVVSVETPVERGRGDREALPLRFGWLVRLASYHAVAYGSQLRAVLETPEMVALLVAAPQARRILGPLCRMLAVEASVLRPRPAGVLAEIGPEQGSGDAADAIVRKRVRPARGTVDWGRIPLPRGVLAAARRQGVRKAE